MSGLIRYLTAGFLWLVILSAAFAPGIVRMYEASVKKAHIALAAKAGMEKSACEIKELPPEKEFIDNNSFPALPQRTSLIKEFCAFRQPFVHPLYARIPTPPPRPAV
ncbi:hypothetical protein [Niabella aurantiaca]|uniref:hypothetical protein n=1 Tax=Niabella aurantiaca TaxID=379900 RepID=UPI0003723176|nr:hypothetical protein [Niabella aurantiaca]